MTHYRPDIDGLRAVSVLAVLTFHGFPSLAPGGFVGVDVFFVISGYLISGILFDAVDAGTFSLREFYARRIRRLFPALGLVISASLLAGWWVLLPADMSRLGAQSFSSATFVANFYFWFQSGYFGPDARTLPLLHLWSLGVEEQFYILWPICLLAIRSKLTWIPSIIFVLGALSFLLNITSIERPSMDFYSPWTRGWELMAGALVAWLHRSQYRADRLADVTTTLGLILVGGSVFLLNADVPYPGWFALIPVLGTALVIWSGSESFIGERILSVSALVFVGRISYPLYLWHWPILVLTTAFKFAPLTSLEIALALVSSLLLAWLTFIWVERPFRSRGFGSAKVAFLAGGMAAVAIAGVIVVNAAGFRSRFPEQVAELAQPKGYPREWRVNECLIESEKRTTFATSCLETNRPLVLIWGDSIAAALMPGLRNLQTRSDFGIAQLTTAGCPPLLSVDISGTPRCREANDHVLRIIQDNRPDTVLLQSRGTYLSDERSALARTIQTLHELSVHHIVLLGPPPVWKKTLVGEALSYYVKNHMPIPHRYAKGVYQVWDDRKMSTFTTELGADYVSLWDVLCDPVGCLTRLSERPSDLVILDQSHLTEGGSKYVVDIIKEKIVPLGRAERTEVP